MAAISSKKAYSLYSPPQDKALDESKTYTPPTEWKLEQV